MDLKIDACKPSKQAVSQAYFCLFSINNNYN